MKSIFRNNLVKPGTAIALAVAGLLGGTAAQAAGTVSGIIITNLATLAYMVGGTTQTPIGSSATGNTTGTGTTTDFLVDNKVNLTVTTSDTTFVTVVPGQAIGTAIATQVATFVVTNTGNTVQDFGLSSLFNYPSTTTYTYGTTTVTNTINPTACSIKVGTATPTYAGATTATYIDELAPDAARTVYVVCAIPLSAVDADIAVISLNAQALAGGITGTQGTALTATPLTTANDNAKVDIVFADAAGTDDSARDGKASSRDVFKVGSAKLTVTKTVTPVCDPFNGNANNGAKNIPGSYVRYRISIANATGAASATLDNVADTLVSSLAFDSDLILIDQTLTASSVNSASTAAACKSVTTGGTATSGSGNVNIVQTNRSINAFRVGTLTGSTLTVNLVTALPVQSGYLAGELKAGESVSVTFQALIN